MKARLYIFILLLAVCGVSRGQVYQMDIELIDGSIVSYPMAKVRDVTYSGGQTIVNLRGASTYRQKVYNNDNIKNISWSPYQGALTPLDAQEYQMDENRRTVVTPYYSVDFDIMCLESEKKLTVKRQTDVPALFEDGKGVTRAISYDFDLEGQHELNGIVEIRIPMRMHYGTIPFAAYRNKETGEWESVNFSYDSAAGEIIIKTNHLSEYTAFEVERGKARAAHLKYNYIPWVPTSVYKQIASALIDIVYSPNPDAAAVEKWTSETADCQQLGIDVTFQAMQSMGFRSDALEQFANVLGYVGTAVSVYQIMRADFHGNDAQVAGQTLKLCLGESVKWAAYYCGNAILTASLASVAILDYSINQFAQKAWSGRRDIYRKAYELYYQKGHPGYRSATDWFNIMYPIMKRKDLTSTQIHEMVDQEVRNHVWKFWQDETVVAEYVDEAHDKFGFSFGGGLLYSIKQELSEEQRGELYNGYLASVFYSIKNHIEQELWEKADDQMKKYTREVNKWVMLTFRDSGRENDRSQYAYCTVRFKNVPPTLEDAEEWKVKLNEEGRGDLLYRVYAMFDASLKPEMEVINEKGEKVMEFELKELRSGYNMDTANNDIDLNDYYPLPDGNAEDQYDITMTPNFQHVDFEMGGFADEYSLDEYMGTKWYTNSVPDERDGIYFDFMIDDVVEAMRCNKFFKVEPNGVIRRKSDGLELAGAYDKGSKRGSGDFTLKCSRQTTVMTEDQFLSIYNSWNVYKNYMNDNTKRWGWINNLMEGTMSHEISGKFTIEDRGDHYVFQFKGAGSYTLDAVALSKVINIKWNVAGGGLYYAGDTELETTNVTVHGNTSMDYQFTVRK